MLKTLAGLLDFGTGHREQTTSMSAVTLLGGMLHPNSSISTEMQYRWCALPATTINSMWHIRMLLCRKSGLAYQRQIGFLSMTGTPHRVFFSLNFDQNHHLDSLNVDQNRNLDQGSRLEFC